MCAWRQLPLNETGGLIPHIKGWLKAIRDPGRLTRPLIDKS
jgi:hypothetical protein